MHSRHLTGLPWSHHAAAGHGSSVAAMGRNSDIEVAHLSSARPTKDAWVEWMARKLVIAIGFRLHSTEGPANGALEEAVDR